MRDRPAIVLWVALAALLGLRIVAGLDTGMRLWGLDVHRFLGPIWGWGLLAVIGLALLPALARRFLPFLVRAGEFVTSSGRAHWSAAMLGAALAWLMFDRLWFTGDFLLRQGYVEAGWFASQFQVALPLDRFLHSSLFGWLASGSVWSANLAARVLGAIEAGAFAATAVAFARAAGLRGEAAIAAACIVLFAGYLTMFTGLGKPASEMCLLVACTALFGLRVARGQRGLLALGLTVAAGFLIHRSSLALLPAWILAVVSWARRRPEARPERGVEAWAALGIPLVTIAIMTPRIMAIAGDYDLPRHILTADVAGRGWAAATLEPRRLAGLGNLMVALSPLGLLVPVLLLGSRERKAESDPLRLLLALAISFVPALLLIHPQHGLFKDWDVFAPAGVAWSALVAYVASRALERSSKPWLVVPLIASAAIPGFQWLLVNRHVESGLARVGAYADHGMLATTADRALLWDFLAARNFRLSRWTEAADAAAKAAELAPHRRVLLMWALAETMRRDDRKSQQIYRRILERDPDDPLGLIGVAGTALRLGDEPEAERALGRVRAFGSGSPEAHTIRRHLAYYPQVWPSDSLEVWPER